LRYRWALRKIKRRYAPRIKQAGAATRQSIIQEAAEQEWRLEEERYLIEQRVVMKQADRLLIPKPSLDKSNRDEPEYHDRNTIKYKPEVLQRLRDNVRKEQAARREWMVRLAPLIIGILGALSGLIAVWQRTSH
jgi:hypothetical protein